MHCVLVVCTVTSIVCMQSVSDYAAANCITQKDIMIRQVYIETQNSIGTLVLVFVFSRCGSRPEKYLPYLDNMENNCRHLSIVLVLKS